jgi:two-component system nitrate/nitrite response regulator NarL
MHRIKIMITLAREGGLGMVRVLIVDGQDEIRQGLRMRLAIEPDIAVIGETGKAGEALYLAQALEPDVIVVDIGMQGAEGVNIVKRLRAAAPSAAVVVLTLRGDEDTRTQARQAGAQVFLEKCGGTTGLLQAIHQFAA